MKMTAVAVSSTSKIKSIERISAKTIKDIHEKYKEYPIRRGHKEKDFQFVRRIVFDVILEVNFSISIYRLIGDLEVLLDIGIDKGFLLSTIVFKGANIFIDGHIIYASEVDKELARNILRNGEMGVSLAGGEIGRTELYSYIRSKTAQPLSEKILYSSLYNKGNLKWKKRKEKTIIYLKQR